MKKKKEKDNDVWWSRGGVLSVKEFDKKNLRRQSILYVWKLFDLRRCHDAVIREDESPFFSTATNRINVCTQPCRGQIAISIIFTSIPLYRFIYIFHYLSLVMYTRWTKKINESNEYNIIKNTILAESNKLTIESRNCFVYIWSVTGSFSYLV